MATHRIGEGEKAGVQSWAAHLRATIILGLPLVGAQLAQMAIGATDVLMLGRLGARELAAGVLGTQMFFFFYIFGIGFSNAVMPLAAHAHGRGDVRAVRRSVRMGLWVACFYAAPMMVALWHTETILVVLGQEPDLARMAGSYVRVVQWGLFPALFMMGLRSFFSAIGGAQVILWAMLGGVAINIVLDYAFIFGHFGAPGLGIVGAAVASLGTNVLVFAILAGWAAMRPHFRAYELFVRFWRPDWKAFFEILRLGLPISMTIIAEVGLFMMASVMMGWLGTASLAAHGIAIQLASITFMAPLGLAQAGTVRVSQAHGRNNIGDLDRAALTVTVLAVALAASSAIAFWLAPGPLVGLFLNRADPLAPQVASLAVPLLAVAAAFQVVDSLQVTGASLLRGLRDTRVPMIMALIAYWPIGAATAYVLGFVAGLGGVGIWSGLAFGLACAAVAMNWRFHRRAAYGLVRKRAD